MVGPWRPPAPEAEPDLRQRARERLQHGGRTELRNTHVQDVPSVLEELQVHQFELEIQNEELRATQAALAESRDRYRQLYDAAPIGYVTLEGDRIAEINRAACEILGYTREHALDTPLVHFIAPESLTEYRHHRDAVRNHPGPHRCELVLHRLAGKHWHIELESSTAHAEHAGQCNCAIIDITARKQAESRTKQLERDFMSATDLERSRISRELHDGVSQELAALAMLARGVEQRLADAGSAESEAVAELGRELRNAVRGLRVAVYDLAPPELGHDTLGVALANLAAETNRLGSIDCHSNADASVGPVDISTGLQLLRIAREAVHNACKHAAPTRIDIALRRIQGTLELTIEDDGCGIPAREDGKDEDNAPNDGRAEGLGLRSMRYRAHLLDARLEIAPRTGGGTVVRCTLEVQIPQGVPPPLTGG
ncbi:MAG: ATP-binding protein [Halofilum sp. (in: g-proteobacteria)]